MKLPSSNIAVEPSTVSATSTTRAAERAIKTSTDPEQLVDAARRLEGVFLNLVFEEMAKTVPQDGLYGHTPGMDMVQGWLRTELSERWAESGGVGVGDAIATQVGGEDAAFVVAIRSPQASFAPPVVGTVSSPYGIRAHPVVAGHELHEGVDIAVPVGTEVRSPFPGTITRVEDHPNLGRMVVVSHPAGYQTTYGHLSSATVEVGDPVSPGTIVGRSGESGRATGPHLHFSMYRDGESVDPSAWIPALGSVEDP